MNAPRIETKATYSAPRGLTLADFEMFLAAVEGWPRTTEVQVSHSRDQRDGNHTTITATLRGAR